MHKSTVATWLFPPTRWFYNGLGRGNAQRARWLQAVTTGWETKGNFQKSTASSCFSPPIPGSLYDKGLLFLSHMLTCPLQFSVSQMQQPITTELIADSSQLILPFGWDVSDYKLMLPSDQSSNRSRGGTSASLSLQAPCHQSAAFFSPNGQGLQIG